MDIESNIITFKQDSLINVLIECKYSKLILVKIISNIMFSASLANNCPHHLIKIGRNIKQYFNCKMSKGLLHPKQLWNYANIFYII